MTPPIPDPQKSGGAGTQAAASAPANVTVLDDTPAYGTHITDALRGLAATNTKRMGGDVGAQLLVASVSTITDDLQSTKRELRETRQNLDKTKDELAATRVENGVLKERLSNLNGIRHLRNIGIVIGTALFGYGLKMNSPGNIGHSLMAIGILMILLSWFAGPGKLKS